MTTSRRFLAHFEHQSRRFLINVFQVNANGTRFRNWHKIIDESYFGRNTSSTGFFAIAWDGTTFNGPSILTVPDGQYVVEISVLKALGDVNDPADTELWESPLITIDRP